MTVDVLIPTRGRPAALAVTLTSLCAQTYRDFRVIVSDQTEGEEALRAGEVRAAVRVLRLHGHEVELHRHLPARGIAEQRDFLLGLATAPHALCLDDDLILEPWVVERLVEAIRREGCGFVGSAFIGLGFADDVRPHEQEIELWEGPVEPEVVRYDTPAWERWRLHSAANLLHAQQRLGITPEDARLYRVAWVPGCVLYDTAKLRGVGGFGFWRELPEAHSGEDVLAQLRVMKRWGGCGLIPSGVYHQELPTTIPERGVPADRVLGWAEEAEAAP